jgi:formamidopyrimidine-DNA glycosylase
MPELPEVETVKRGLEPNLIGKTIKECTVYRHDLRIPVPQEIAEKIEGGKVEKLIRRSKYLLIDYGREDYLVIHLGMSGKLLYLKDDSLFEKAKHDHFHVKMDDNSSIVFNDARRFGLVTLINKREFESHKLISHLGPEPLTDAFDAKYLINKFKNKQVNIKQAIMDSKNVVGVGNIYASESLFRTSINPTKLAGKISSKKLGELVINIKQVLESAISSGGSTLRDYVRSDGDIGYFQHSFKVYGRENAPCLICSTDIKRIVQQGRSSFYCPKCQK